MARSGHYSEQLVEAGNTAMLNRLSSSWASRYNSADTREWQVAPWIVLLAGQELEVIDARSRPPAITVLGETHKVLTIIDTVLSTPRTINEMIESARRESALEAMLQAGILIPKITRNELQQNSSLLLGNGVLSIVAGTTGKALTQYALSLTSILTRASAEQPSEMVVRFEHDAPTLELRRIANAVVLTQRQVSVYPGLRARFELVVNKLEVGQELTALLDSVPQIQLVKQIHNTTYNGHLEEALGSVQTLSKMGFAVIVELIGWMPNTLRQVVVMSLERNENAGVRITPGHLENNSDAERSAQEVADATQEVAHILHLCEPWRSIYTTASVGWHDRQGWHPPVRPRLDKNIARDSVNLAFDPTTAASPTMCHSIYAPRCTDCGLAGICDRFCELAAELSTAADILDERYVHYECTLRQRLLPLLIDEWKRSAPKVSRGATGTMKAMYANGRLHLQADL